MNLLWEIFLKTVEILTLVFGILGMTLSLTLLFAPRAARTFSSVFNRSLDVDQKLGFLDKQIPTENLFYSHPLLVGSLLSAGSVFALLFFLFNFDVNHFTQIFFGASDRFSAGEILFQTVAWVGRLGCLLGAGAGLILMLAPHKLRAIEQGMNRWVETRELIEKLNRPVKTLDTVFFRYPILFGLLVGSISCLLIILSVLNLLR